MDNNKMPVTEEAEEAVQLDFEDGEAPLSDDPDALTFSLEEVFEGPLDLLLALIAKNKVNIYDIPISLIFEQYMEYIDRMNMLNMEVTSEFIVMAAQLMVIKSRMLLPKLGDDEEDPRQELVDMLLEHQRAKSTAEELHERELTYSGTYEKPPEKIPDEPEYSLKHDIRVLEEAFRRVYTRKIEMESLIPMEEPISDLLTATRQVSVGEKITTLIKGMKVGEKKTLCSLFFPAESKHELVAIFLAVLELIKSRRAVVHYIHEEDCADCDIELISDEELEYYEEID